MVDVVVGGASSGGGGGGTSALAFMSFAQGITGAYSQYQNARARRLLAKANKQLAEMDAVDALKRGQEAVAITRGKTKKLIGSQRAAIAAQGIRADIGSAADIQQEAQDIGELDVLAIRNNAAREAYGYKVKAIEASLEGRLAISQGRTRAFDTLATGALRSASFLGG